MARSKMPMAVHPAAKSLVTGLLSLAFVSYSLWPAEADEGNAVYVEDAERSAYLWSKDHSDGVGVAVLEGTDPVVTHEQIEAVFSKALSENGVQKVAFFYQINDITQTGFYLVANQDVFGPYGVGKEVRDAIPIVAQQAMLARKYPALRRGE